MTTTNPITLKQVQVSTRGRRADIGPIKIFRLLSNEYVDMVGHFVFLDYIPPRMVSGSDARIKPEAAHPHRGIATLTYILEGQIEHFDSRGHRGIVSSGGVQWMKAGNGIIHNEALGPDAKVGSTGHGFQFWINLPAEKKRENPEYMAVEASALPLVALGDAGSLKVVVGEYAGKKSRIPTYALQNLYHLYLNPGKSFAFAVPEGLEYAAFLLKGSLIISGAHHDEKDFVAFDTAGGEIEFINNSSEEAEIILFGGEKYTEPVVAQGPFVMNTHEEISQAIADFYQGRYGQMNYD